MTDTITTAIIEPEPTVPIIRVTWDSVATAPQLFRAHIDPELFARWVGPDGMTTTLDRGDARSEMEVPRGPGLRQAGRPTRRR